MPSNKDVKAHVKEVRDRSQYQATRLFISIAIAIYMVAGILIGVVSLAANPLVGIAVICITILFSVITKQMSIILIDIADALHYQGAYEKFTAWMDKHKQNGAY